MPRNHAHFFRAINLVLIGFIRGTALEASHDGAHPRIIRKSRHSHDGDTTSATGRMAFEVDSLGAVLPEEQDTESEHFNLPGKAGDNQKGNPGLLQVASVGLSKLNRHMRKADTTTAAAASTAASASTTPAPATTAASVLATTNAVVGTAAPVTTAGSTAAGSTTGAVGATTVGATTAAAGGTSAAGVTTAAPGGGAATTAASTAALATTAPAQPSIKGNSAGSSDKQALGNGTTKDAKAVQKVTDAAKEASEADDKKSGGAGKLSCYVLIFVTLALLAAYVYNIYANRRQPQPTRRDQHHSENANVSGERMGRTASSGSTTSNGDGRMGRKASSGSTTSNGQRRRQPSVIAEEGSDSSGEDEPADDLIKAKPAAGSTSAITKSWSETSGPKKSGSSLQVPGAQVPQVPHINAHRPSSEASSDRPSPRTERMPTFGEADPDRFTTGGSGDTTW